MRVLIIEPNKAPYESVIGEDLKSMQNVVGGYIEVVNLDDHSVLICNEEGKFLELEGNRRVGRDIIAGTFFICGCNDKMEFCSLNDELVDKFNKRFENVENHTIEEVNNSIFIEVYSDNGYQEHDEGSEVDL